MTRDEIIRDIEERAYGAGADQYMTIRCDAARETVRMLREHEKEIKALHHFDADMSDLREYLHDKEAWSRKQAEAIPKWIPVTDRLPEVGEDVLIYAVGKSDDFSSVIAITNRMIFRLFPSSEGVETWSSPWQYFMTDYEITHWMPLPEPPKEEKE
jgi:hypothetical protein